jgi:hypothetical protein
MRRNNLKKIILIGLVFAQLAMLPALAFAQYSVPTTDSNNGNTPGGVAGTVANGVAMAALAAANAANTACQTIEQKYFNTATTKQLAFSGLSIIGGSNVQLAQYATDLVAIDGPPGDITVPPLGFIPCRQFVLGLLDKIIANNIFIANQRQTLYNAANTALANLKAREESIKAKQANATQGFWKTLVFNILIKTSKAVADSLVAKLVNNYKISNFKQYADSAATLMYDNQFIRENFPKAQDQLMARAILNNPLLRTQIQPGIFVAADAALGYNPASLNPASPNFYGQMAAMGSPSANPYYLQTAYVGGLDQSRAASMATAQQQISQGSGYKAPVNCAGSLNQQKLIDAQAIALQNKVQDRQNLLDSLISAQQAGQNVPAADLAKAQADADAARTAWLSAPEAVKTSSGSTSTDPAIIMCEAISSPAVLVNQGIDSVIKAMGGNISQYSDNNLPAFMNIIGDVASQIGSSLILGGARGGATAALINENKAVSATVAVASQAAASNASANLAKGVNFGADLGGASNSYSLNWQIITDILPKASFVTISGDGISASRIDPATRQAVPNRLSLSGDTTITTAVGGPYILTVYDINGRALTAVTTTITPESQQALNYNPNAPAVAGAFTQHHFENSESGAGFTKRPAILTRGPASQLSIR